jgi:hypothetical protein
MDLLPQVGGAYLLSFWPHLLLRAPAQDPVGVGARELRVLELALPLAQHVLVLGGTDQDLVEQLRQEQLRQLAHDRRGRLLLVIVPWGGSRHLLQGRSQRLWFKVLEIGAT